MRRSEYYQSTYSQSHASDGYGRHYQGTFRKGYYAIEWELIERPLLVSILTRDPEIRTRRCLDFACGTGRITSVLAGQTREVVGVDIAKAMIEAAVVPDNADVRVHDIITSPLDDQFDIVTAFRFFLNAEPELREAAMAAIVRQLAPGGILVENIHVNSDAPLGMIYRIRNRLTGVLHNRTVSKAEFVDLAARHGLTLRNIDYYGYTPRPGPIEFPGMRGAMKIVESCGRLIPAGRRRLANSFICTFEKS